MVDGAYVVVIAFAVEEDVVFLWVVSLT